MIFLCADEFMPSSDANDRISFEEFKEVLSNWKGGTNEAIIEATALQEPEGLTEEEKKERICAQAFLNYESGDRLLTFKEWKTFFLDSVIRGIETDGQRLRYMRDKRKEAFTASGRSQEEVDSF